MLVNLQDLDVVVSQPEANRGYDEQCSHQRLRSHRTAESFPRNHDSSCICDEG